MGLSIKNFQFSKIGVSCIVILILFFLCVFYIPSFTKQTKSMPDISELIKLTLAHSYYYGYTDDHVARNKDFHPPIYFYTSALLCKLLFSRFAFQGVILINVFWFLLTIITIYFSILKICHERYLMLFGILFFSFIPGLIYGIRHYIVEISVMSAVSLFICSFIYADNFNNRIASFALGVSIAFGMLCKYTFPLYIILPLIIAIYSVLVDKDRERIKNLGITAVVAFIGFFWWYILFFNRHKVLYFLHDNLKMECAGIKQGYHFFLINNLKRIIFLFKKILSRELAIIASLLFLAVLFKEKLFRYKVIWFWILAILISFIFLPTNCSFRYLLPILPVVTLAFTVTVQFFGKKLSKWIIIFLLIFLVKGNITGVSLQKSNKGLNSAENFLTYILEDAKKQNITNPLVGLDTFHDPRHIVQDIYFSLWFLKLRDSGSFRIFYKDIEMLEAAKKDYFKRKYDNYFKEYRGCFIKCDYLISAQEWQGWLGNFYLLTTADVMIKDDIDQHTSSKKYYLFRRAN